MQTNKQLLQASTKEWWEHKDHTCEQISWIHIFTLSSVTDYNNFQIPPYFWSYIQQLLSLLQNPSVTLQHICWTFYKITDSATSVLWQGPLFSSICIKSLLLTAVCMNSWHQRVRKGTNYHLVSLLHNIQKIAAVLYVHTPDCSLFTQQTYVISVHSYFLCNKRVGQRWVDRDPLGGIQGQQFVQQVLQLGDFAKLVFRQPAVGHHVCQHVFCCIDGRDAGHLLLKQRAGWSFQHLRSSIALSYTWLMLQVGR